MLRWLRAEESSLPARKGVRCSQCGRCSPFVAECVRCGACNRWAVVDADSAARIGPGATVTMPASIEKTGIKLNANARLIVDGGTYDHNLILYLGSNTDAAKNYNLEGNLVITNNGTVKLGTFALHHGSVNQYSGLFSVPNDGKHGDGIRSFCQRYLIGIAQREPFL